MKDLEQREKELRDAKVEAEAKRGEVEAKARADAELLRENIANYLKAKKVVAGSVTVDDKTVTIKIHKSTFEATAKGDGLWDLQHSNNRTEDHVLESILKFIYTELDWS